MIHAPVLTRRFVPGKADWPVETHLYAPLPSRRLHHQTPGEAARIKTFIDYSLQLSMEQLALDYSVNLPPHTSLAILAMNNETGGVEAYAGSADFFNTERFGHVDMAAALRSPGLSMMGENLLDLLPGSWHTV